VLYRIRMKVPSWQRRPPGKPNPAMFDCCGGCRRTPRYDVRMRMRVLLTMILRLELRQLRPRLLWKGHDPRPRHMTLIMVLLVLLVLVLLLLFTQLLLLLLLLQPCLEHCLSSSFAPALWTPSRLGDRVATCRGLGWMLETILTWSSTVTFDVGSFAACTSNHRDHQRCHHGLVKVCGDGRGYCGRRRGP